MAAMTNIPFLEPVLDYLSSVLPPPVYNALITITSYSLKLLGILYTLTGNYIVKSYASWDMQTVLPPLITLFAAYLALLSFYRTTGWMIRTMFWVIKWGAVLSFLFAGAGFLLGSSYADPNNIVFKGKKGKLNFIAPLAGLILDVFAGPNPNAAAGKSHASTSSRSRARVNAKSTPRPKAWESWDKHRKWQHSEDAKNRGEGEGVAAEMQKVLGDIVGTAGQAFWEGRWWEAAKGAVESFSLGQSETESEEKSTQPDKKGKAKTGSR